MNTKALGERIQIAREERCITQRELAEAVGCTPQHISAIERGVKKVTIMDGRVPHSILMELLTDEGAGTEVVADPVQEGAGA